MGNAPVGLLGPVAKVPQQESSYCHVSKGVSDSSRRFTILAGFLRFMIHRPLSHNLSSAKCLKDPETLPDDLCQAAEAAAWAAASAAAVAPKAAMRMLEVVIDVCHMRGT